MTPDEFRSHAHELVDWMAEYMENVRSYPVRSTVRPKEILAQLPAEPPDQPEPFTDIFEDFKRVILPGMTHWQHPSFFAYFPANSSPPSVLAEMLTATLGAQCMSWVTSPAATELEERMMGWLGQMLGLPPSWRGVIQDTASTATLCSILSARESKSEFLVNERGFAAAPRFTAYCSTETHSSIEKGVKIAGIGRENLRKVAVDKAFALRPDALEEAITADARSGRTPLLVVAALGTTGSTAIDPLRPIGEICRRHNVWLHVDAAFAGAALALPEMRWMSDGLEYADTFVVNPHKWMMTNFDCSAYYVQDPAALVRTFEILPEYLRTADMGAVDNYRDWGIPQGRRFRALKLWFVLRSFGVSGIQEKLRHDISLAHQLAEEIRRHPAFEVLAPVPVNTICFRVVPPGLTDPSAIDALNAEVLERLNATGSLYMTHTRLNGSFAIRMVIGQTNVQQRHVDRAWSLIRETALGVAGARQPAGRTDRTTAGPPP
jgi:aromatic-L-amino-acid decarboxylase